MTSNVSHFWQKKLAEDKLEEIGVPFGALRPGAFLDQVTQDERRPLREETPHVARHPKTVPLTFVLTADLAGYLAQAVDAPVGNSERIDIGWDRPIRMQDVADISTRLMGETIKVRAVPPGVLRAVGAVAGLVVPGFKDMGAMVAWFETGKYVADVTRQAQVFGPPPTAEGAIARFAESLGHEVNREPGVRGRSRARRPGPMCR